MRKIKGLMALFILLLVGYYMIYYTGLYLDINPNKPVTVQSKTKDKTIYIKNNEDEKYKAFEVKGVEVASSIAGYYGTDYAVDKKTWLRWFEQIQEMGANTIKVPTIYDDTFYNAFYEFNHARKDPLYLFQGIQVSDYANNSHRDAYSKEFFETLQEDSIVAVDIIHGKRNINTNNIKGSGKYRKDISPWVLGYIVGNGWNPGTMAYTNNNKNYKTKYEGKYFITAENSTVFEAMLAEIMDGMASYESKKYKMQRLISFFNDPQNDPFVYEKQYAQQLGKYNHLDAENIKPTEEFKSGYVATYRLYAFCPEFGKYFSQEQKVALSKELEMLNQDLFYDGYTQLLSNYHSMPVMISGYGFSSARGTDRVAGPMTEIEQGQALASTHQDIVDSGCSGSIISTWQDTWERRAWNTSYAVDVQEAFRWHDVQTQAQGYGLLSFDPGNEKLDCYIDGDSSEWEEEEIVLSIEETTLSVKYDESFVYLLVEKEGLTNQTQLYIPIDTTPKSGSSQSENPKLMFERDADFLLCILGERNSEILVQERYEALRENYLMQTDAEDPFVSPPLKNSPNFKSIKMICENSNMLLEDMVGTELKDAKLFDTYKTGGLVYGNSNPESTDYNSLADFHYGNNCVEIRIPWQILNFSNPSKMKIHDDYYENYGVEEISISKLYLGVCELNQSTPATMVEVNLKGWENKTTYHERLKKSYFILKEGWGK